MELHFVAGSKLAVGGVEMHALAFARHFARHSDVELKALFLSNEQTTFEEMLDCDKQRDGQLVVEKLSNDPERDAAALLRNVGSKNAIIFSNTPIWLPMIYLAKVQMPELRVIVRSGGNDLLAGWGVKARWPYLRTASNRFVKMVNTCVDRLIVNSDYSRDRLEERGVEAHRMVKVIGGVDCQEFQPVRRARKRVFQIANVCRFVEMKGIDVAIRTISELVKRGRCDVHYTLTGEGKSQSRLVKLVRALGISDNVTFASALPMNEIASAYQAADLFLHTPIYAKRPNKSDSFFRHTETMGRSLCEASAVGLAIVTSRVGGVPEIVRDGTTGLVVEEGDYVAAAECVERLMDDPSLSQAMGHAGRKCALELWNWPIVFTKYRKMFSELC